MPNPPHTPTAEIKSRVLELATKGHGSRIIASAVGLHRETLNKYYEQELATGRTQFAERLARVHLDCLEDEDARVRQVSAIWLEKSRLHYSDHMKQEISGPDGQPLQVQPVLNVHLSGNKPEPS